MTMVAFTLKGYQGMVKLSSASHTRDNYHYKPRVDYNMLAEFGAEYGDDVAVFSGCYFGIVSQPLVNEGMKAAKAVANTFAKWFPNFHIEIQRHNISDDDHDDFSLSQALYKLAIDLKLPIMIGQDAHYERISEKPLHDAYKNIAYMTPEDRSFPGDSYHLARTAWMKSHYEEDKIGRKIWQESLESCKVLLDAHTLTMPALDEYEFRVPKYGGLLDPNDALWIKVDTKLKDLGLNKKYMDRALNEMAVIQQQGFADYFLMVEDVVSWAGSEKILVQARGSASGSLICYLLGITQVDPIEWDLLFERFLSKDRTKPPDIDLDIEDWRREEVIEYLKRHRDVIQMGTYTRLGLNEDGKGSLLVQFLSTQRKQLGTDFPKYYGRVQTVDDLPSEDRRTLEALSEYRPKKSPGAHAAGYVVASKEQTIDDYLPTMLIPSSGHEVTQMVMEDVEDLGYVKLDLLGQRTLSTMRRALELIGKDALDDGFDWIPNDDKETCAMIRKSDTQGVFQLEGWTAASGCKEMQVRSTMDVIYVMALFRPATIESGYKDQFLESRRASRSRGRKRGMVQQVEYPHPIFEEHLKATYGVAVFQEQIMGILRDLGVPVENLNAFLKALKSSNDKAWQAHETFQKSRAEYIELARAAGMKKKVAKESWEMISGFAGYGFNRAHGVAYGLLAYRAAYLKTHYPLEYMAALLETSVSTHKEKDYTAEARRMGIRILAPDINVSGRSWTLDTKKKGIRKGLMAIKGVGARAADTLIEHQPYTDMQELIQKVPAKQVTGGREYEKTGELKGTLEILRKAGALRSLGVQP